MDSLVTILAVILGWTLSEFSSRIQNKRKSTAEQKGRIDTLGVDVYILCLDAVAWAQSAFQSNRADLDDDHRIIQLTGRAYHCRARALRLRSELNIKSSRVNSLLNRLDETPTADGRRLEFLEDHSDRICRTLIAIQDVMREKSWGPFDPVYSRHDTLQDISGDLNHLQQSMMRYLAADDSDVEQAIADATSQAHPIKG